MCFDTCSQCRNSQIFWSDVASAQIYRANMDGSDAEVIVNEGILVVGKRIPCCKNGY